MKHWVALLLLLFVAPANAATFAISRATQPVSQDGNWNVNTNPAFPLFGVVTDTNVPTLFKQGQLIGNSSFSVSGSSVVVFQGDGPWNVNGSTVYVQNVPGQSLIVSGQSAVGTAPANNPVSVSGVDNAGLKRAILTDATGRVQTVEGSVVSTNPYSLANGATTQVRLDSTGDQFVKVQDTNGSGTISAAGQTVVMTPSGYSGLAISITGVWVGTMTVEASVGDNVWRNIEIYSEDQSTSISTVTFNQFLQHSVGSLRFVRLRASQWTSGTATITWNLGLASSHQEVVQPDPEALGAEVYGNVTSTAPTYTDGDLESLSLDTEGNLRVIQAPTSFGTDYFACSKDGGVNAANASSDNPIYLLVNLSTNTKSMYIVQRIGNTNVVNVGMQFNMYLDPVVTSSGTTNTISRIGTQNDAPQIQCYTLPTVSSEGSIVDQVVLGQNSPPFIMADNPQIVVKPGHSVLITANPSSNNRQAIFSIKWIEQQ